MEEKIVKKYIQLLNLKQLYRLSNKRGLQWPKQEGAKKKGGAPPPFAYSFSEKQTL